MLASACDRDAFRTRIDAVLHELGDRLERIALRERDDADRVPIIANAQLPTVFAFHFNAGFRKLDGTVFGTEHERLALVAGDAQEIETSIAPRPIGRAKALTCAMTIQNDPATNAAAFRRPAYPTQQLDSNPAPHCTQGELAWCYSL